MHIDKPIFILGIPRSGTSMIAGLLNICGAWVGTTVPGGPENPRGYFENWIIRDQINKQFLLKIGCDPLGVSKLPDIELLPKVENLSDIVKKAIKSDGYEENKQWLYKGAKLTLLWPIYKSAFPEARWVIVRRREEDIINSCLNTHFMVQHSIEPVFWTNFINEYLIRLKKLKSSGVWFREIWPHAIVKGNTETLRQLIDDLGLFWDYHKINEFILPSYWHTKE